MFLEVRSSPRPSIILIDVNEENNESLCVLTLLYRMVSPQLIKGPLEMLQASGLNRILHSLILSWLHSDEIL